ncbi:expressed unknown protein (Partial), partial [Seminavis robusta]
DSIEEWVQLKQDSIRSFKLEHGEDLDETKPMSERDEMVREVREIPVKVESELEVEEVDV